MTAKNAELDSVAADNDDDEAEIASNTTLFIKNLSFETTLTSLQNLFGSLPGYRSASIPVKKNSKGDCLSMGFGFAEFATLQDAKNALVALQVCLIEDFYPFYLRVVEHRLGWTCASN